MIYSFESVAEEFCFALKAFKLKNFHCLLTDESSIVNRTSSFKALRFITNSFESILLCEYSVCSYDGISIPFQSSVCNQLNCKSNDRMSGIKSSTQTLDFELHSSQLVSVSLSLVKHCCERSIPGKPLRRLLFKLNFSSVRWLMSDGIFGA